MANISAKDVAELRKKTGCGMMECKNALVEANGNMDEAIKILRERGIAVAAKKADRIAAEGLVDIAIENGVGAIIEVNSETDFVAKNDTFKAFVAQLLHIIITEKPADVAALLAATYEGETTVEAQLKQMIFTIGENMSIRR
ncbi:MAG: translation elongation factor Ts, partial [Clostridia bacterium]|nr:translation elongation factor Ts [Clostridia bacterium]